MSSSDDNNNNEEEEAVMVGLCVLVVFVLCTPVVLVGSHDAYHVHQIGKQRHIGDCQKDLFKTK
jgi:hypothetical protein